MAAYVWDMARGGHPLQLIHTEIDAVAFTALKPPRSEITSLEALKQLWKGAALKEIETRQIRVQRILALPSILEAVLRALQRLVKFWSREQ